MVKTLISTNVYPKELTFKPGSYPAIFEVNAVNYSEKFASFQVEVLAAGTDENLIPNWYRISPDICTKKPPGDSTQFIVEILDTPLPGFVGQINLTVRVFSIELQEETRQLLRLTVQEGTGGVPLKLTLPLQEFQAYPQQQIKIPVQLYNPSSQPGTAALKLTGINPAWIVEEQQLLHIPSRVKVDTAFLCQIPDISQANSQVYPFTIVATLTGGLSSQIGGNLSVLPRGIVEFRCSTKERRIPNKRRYFWRSDPVTFQLEFENRSNVNPTCKIDVQSEEKIEYDFTPEQLDLKSGETDIIFLVTRVKRPWFGRVRKLLIEVAAELSDGRLSGTSPQNQTLQLKVLPLIPTWLIFGGSFLLLCLLWWLSWLNPENPFFGHKEPVNSVQFDGLARSVISGSSDQTTADWRVDGFFNPLINQFRGKIGNSKKSVRVVRYRPVNNNIMAAGLENGEIQLWWLTGSEQLIDIFSNQKDDRVFALEFTQDSQSLFSGHGSGFVLQWDTSFQRGEMAKGRDRLVNQKKFDFAVYAVVLVGKGNNNLAVAGRYNQFLVWNIDSNKTFNVPYPSGGQDDYILSVDIAEIAPYILATGDNQGNITVWNMRACLEGSGECEMIDRWQAGEGGEAVRSVSLSENGCYLVSGGDDGKVTLWALTSAGKRAISFDDGRVVQQVVNRSDRRKKVNSVQVKIVGKNLLVVSGSDDTQVRVKQQKRRFDLGCDSQINLNLD